MDQVDISDGKQHFFFYILGDIKLKKMAKNSKIQEEFSCFCSKSPAEFNLAKGCEVSAVLHHGSYIR